MKDSLQKYIDPIKGVSYKPSDLIPNYDENSYFLLRSNNIKSGKVVYEDVQIVKSSAVKKSQKLYQNDIVVCMSNGSKRLVGKNAQFNLINFNYCVGAFCAGFRSKDPLISNFIYQLFQSDEYQKYIDVTLAGSAINNLKSSDILNFEFEFPKKPQQQKIAEILNTIDEVIEKTEQAISKYQAIKQGMMHDLFTRGINLQTGKLRPSYKEAPDLYKPSELGMIPKEWIPGKLIDSASTEHYGFTGGPFGSDLQTKHYTLSGVQIIQLQNIGDGEFINKSKVFTSNKKADELRSCNIYPNDIIIAKMAFPVARACIIPNHAERFLMASDGIRLKVNKDEFNTLFVKESINNKYFRTQAIAKSTGTTRERIGLTELKNIKFKYPKLPEQNAIANKIKSVDELIEKEQNNLSKHQQIKKGLMQDLLTGKVEVTV